MELYAKYLISVVKYIYSNRSSIKRFSKFSPHIPKTLSPFNAYMISQSYYILSITALKKEKIEKLKKIHFSYTHKPTTILELLVWPPELSSGHSLLTENKKNVKMLACE